MSDFVTFIDSDYMKTVCGFDLNVDEKLFTSAMILAQEENIRELLGTGLYNEIYSQIDSNTLTNANNILLSGYCKMALSMWTAYEILPFCHKKVTNRSVEKKITQHSESLSEEELQSYRNTFKKHAEFWSNKLIKFLLANSDTYPLYLNPGNGIDDVQPKQSGYKSGLYLPSLKTKFFPRNKGRTEDLN